MNDTHSIRVYVPDNVADSVHDRIKWYLSARLGGFTAYEGTGGWIPDSERAGDMPESRAERFERMCQEPVTVYESVTDSNQPATVAKRCAQMVKSESNEDAVMYDIRPVAMKGMVTDEE